MASVDVEEIDYISASASQNDESVTNGSDVQDRWKGNVRNLGECYGLATKLIRFFVPQSDDIVLGRMTCEKFPVRWIRVAISVEVCFISQEERKELGNVVIPRIRWDGITIDNSDSQAIRCQEYERRFWSLNVQRKCTFNANVTKVPDLECYQVII